MRWLAATAWAAAGLYVVIWVPRWWIASLILFAAAALIVLDGRIATGISVGLGAILTLGLALWVGGDCMFGCPEEVTWVLPACTAAVTAITFLAYRAMRAVPAP